MNEFKYVGSELELFKDAIHWKQYIKNEVECYIRGDVLEVGSGIGSITNLFNSAKYRSWLALEPDQILSNISSEFVNSHKIKHVCGSIYDLKASRSHFDTILYIDVLEHIYDDDAEIKFAFSLLRQGGHLILLSPAHNYLFSEFDRSIGHFRRYDRKIERLFVDFAKVKIKYLDSLGLLCSLFAKLSSQSTPTHSQIMMWDRVVVRMSRIFDQIMFHKVGKSILVIAEK